MEFGWMLKSKGRAAAEVDGLPLSNTVDEFMALLTIVSATWKWEDLHDLNT